MCPIIPDTILTPDVSTHPEVELLGILAATLNRILRENRSLRKFPGMLHVFQVASETQLEWKGKSACSIKQ
jgi:hypothetical protein